MNPDQQRIRDLAYRLWQQRGCPQGRPDDDWFAAERQLSGQKAESLIDEAAKGSFPSSDPPATGLPDNPPANAEEKWAAVKAKRSRKKRTKSSEPESDPPPRYVAPDALGKDANR